AHGFERTSQIAPMPTTIAPASQSSASDCLAVSCVSSIAVMAAPLPRGLLVCPETLHALELAQQAVHDAAVLRDVDLMALNELRILQQHAVMLQRGLQADGAAAGRQRLTKEPEDLAVVDQPDHVEHVPMRRYRDRHELRQMLLQARGHRLNRRLVV